MNPFRRGRSPRPRMETPGGTQEVSPRFLADLRELERAGWLRLAYRQGIWSVVWTTYGKYGARKLCRDLGGQQCRVLAVIAGAHIVQFKNGRFRTGRCCPRQCAAPTHTMRLAEAPFTRHNVPRQIRITMPSSVS